MAKALREPQPSSTVARLLDPESVRRATLPLADSSEREAEIPMCAAGAEPPAPAKSQPALHGLPPARRPIKREILLTAETDAALDDLIARFRSASGARLTASHVVRALVTAAAAAAAQIENEVRQAGSWAMPSNAPTAAVLRRQFEGRVASVIARGMRRLNGAD